MRYRTCGKFFGYGYGFGRFRFIEPFPITARLFDRLSTVKLSFLNPQCLFFRQFGKARLGQEKYRNRPRPHSKRLS